jgi:excisionase family DNA binding protein
MAQVKVPATKTIESPVLVYTSAEVGAILKLSQRSVQRLIQHRQLRAFRCGLSYRVLADDLLAFCRTAGATGMGHNA